MDYSELVARLDELGKAGKAAGIVTIWGQAAAAIRDLLAEREWQPIESAPRDGTRILATGGGLGDKVDVCEYLPRVGAWETWGYVLDDRDDEPEGYSRPTHWLPLPKGPTS